MRKGKNTGIFSRSGFWRGWMASLIFCSCLLPGTVSGDIYKWVDGDGVMHFTNVPTSSKYTLYMKGNRTRVGRGYAADSNAYDDLIQEAADKFGVSFALIKAVIRVESGFNPGAVSKAGARGLMQIMPDNDKTLSLSRPFDPSQNIMAGTKYLKWMLDRYNRNMRLALAAYNAGPGAVDKYKQIPPFKETQNYVKKVLKLYQQYNNA